MKSTAITAFSGLDRRARIADGSCREMENLSAAAYPCLTVRPPRRTVSTGVTALCFRGGHRFTVENTALCRDGAEIAQVTAGEKQWAALGGMLFLWPDKLAVEIATGAVRPMEQWVGPIAVTFTDNTITRADGADWPFAAGDGVTIAGCTAAENNRTAVVQQARGAVLTFLDNIFEGADSRQETVTLSRTVPDLTLVCERDNRIWGTYGDHLCCCKLGDGFNWNVFQGLSTDAFDIASGSDGDFTALVPFSNYLLAFKEQTIHKLLGSRPANFSMTATRAEGVRADCGASAQIVGGQLYYLGRSGVLCYSGGTPEAVGEALGGSYERASAGAYGVYYILSGVRDGTAEWMMLDTVHNVWMREDNTEVRRFASADGVLWAVDAAGNLLQCGVGAERVRWSAVFGPFADSRTDPSRSGRIDLVVRGVPGAFLRIETAADGRHWRTLWQGQADPRDGLIHAPSIPTLGHEFRLRLSGEGGMVLHSIRRRVR